MTSLAKPKHSELCGSVCSDRKKREKSFLEAVISKSPFFSLLLSFKGEARLKENVVQTNLTGCFNVFRRDSSRGSRARGIGDGKTGTKFGRALERTYSVTESCDLFVVALCSRGMTAFRLFKGETHSLNLAETTKQCREMSAKYWVVVLRGCSALKLLIKSLESLNSFAVFCTCCRLKDEVAATKRDLTGAKNDLATKQMRVQKLEQECKKHKEALSKLEAELHTAKEGLEAARNEAETLRKAMNEKKGPGSEVQSGEEEGDVMDELRRKVERLEGELNKLRFAEQEGEESRRKVERLEKELAEVRTGGFSVEELTSLKGEIEKLAREVVQKDEELAGLRESLETKTGEGSEDVSSLQAELASKDALVQALRRSLQEAEQRAALCEDEKERVVAEMQAASTGTHGDQLWELQAMLRSVQEELRSRDGGEPKNPAESPGSPPDGLKSTTAGKEPEGEVPVGERTEREVPTEGAGGEGAVSVLQHELLSTRERLQVVTTERSSLVERVEELTAQVAELEGEVAVLHRATHERSRGVGIGSRSNRPQGESDDDLQTTVDRLRFELREREADLTCLQEDYEVQATKMQETMEVSRYILPRLIVPNPWEVIRSILMQKLSCTELDFLSAGGKVCFV
jgi:predicted  nucleic acid-binding Zn-ribbon protein